MLDNTLTDTLHKPHRVKKMDAARFFDRYALLDIETEDTAPQYVLIVSWKHNEGAFKVAAGAVWFLGMAATMQFAVVCRCVRGRSGAQHSFSCSAFRVAKWHDWL
jgi:hypothetical protein